MVKLLNQKPSIIGHINLRKMVCFVRKSLGQSKITNAIVVNIKESGTEELFVIGAVLK
jgi:hypothetical protein